MIHRGEIYYADLSPVVGSEQGGYRPVIILQNNKGNRYSTTVKQIRTIDKKRIKEKVGKIDNRIMKQINQAIKTSLDIK